MRYNFIITLFVLTLFVLSACQPVAQAPTSKTFCNPPYYEWQRGQCCLDKNSNNVCDQDELTKETPPPTIVEIEEINRTEEVSPPQLTTPSQKTLMQQLIDRAPTAYYFWNFDDDAGALVVGDRRSDGYVEYYLAEFLVPMSWDVNTRQVLFTAPKQIDEWWYNMKQGLSPPKTQAGQVKYFPTYFELNLTGNPDLDLAIIPEQFKKYYWAAGMEKKVQSEKYRGARLPLVFFSAFYTKGPIDMMKEYALEEPIKIEEKPKIISVASRQITANLSIYYKKKEDPSKILVFSYDPVRKVMIRIEEQNDKGQMIKRTDFDFDTTVTYQGKKNTPILEKFVRPFPDYIIITPEYYDEYKEAVESDSRIEYLKDRGG